MPVHVFRVAATLLAASSAAAQDAPPASLTIAGIGAGATLEPYRGVDTKARVLPLLIYENDWVSVALPSVGLKLGSTGPVKYRLNARFGFDGYKARDSDFLRGMDRRKESLWVGGAASWNTGMGQLSLEVSGDALGHSKGRMIAAAYEKRLDFGALAVAPRVGVRHVDRKYVDYYFGVKPTEALPDRPAYVGRSATQAEIGTRFTYATGRQESLFLDVSGRLLGKAVEDSPLVEWRYQANLFGGWMYRF